MKLKKTWKFISGLSIVLALLIIFLLRTKAVWIGLLVTLIVVTFLFIYQKSNIRFKIPIYLSLIVCLIIFNIFFLFILQPIIKKGIDHNTISNSDTTISQNKIEFDNERLLLWHKTYDMIKKNPVAGVGMGNWQIHFPDATLTGLWRAEDLNYTFQRPHNDFLWILAETGFIGFNLFLLLLLTILILLMNIIKFSIHSTNHLLAVILCVAFITGFFTISFFDFPKERIEHLIWINLIFGISYYYIKNQFPTQNILGSLQLNRSVYSIALTTTLLIILIGVLRYKGEFYTRKMYDYKKANRYADVIKAGNYAQSFAYSIDPTSLPIHWYSGNANVNLKNFKTSLEDLKKAFEFNPFNRNVVNDLASAYVVNGDTNQAIKYYTECSRISPRFDDPKLNLAALYIIQKKFEMASHCLDSLFHDSQRRNDYRKLVNAFK